MRPRSRSARLGQPRGPVLGATALVAAVLLASLPAAAAKPTSQGGGGSVPPRASARTLPEAGDRVRPGRDAWFACRSQKLVMAAWFARLARHTGALRALFADDQEVDCVWLQPDDPSVASIRVVDAADSRLGEATIRTLVLRIAFADEGRARGRAVELFSLAGVAGGLEVVR